MNRPLTRFRLGIGLIFVAALILFASVRVGGVVRAEDAQSVSFAFSATTRVLSWSAAACCLCASLLMLSARIGWPRLLGLLAALLFAVGARGAWMATTSRIDLAPDRLTLPGYGSSVVVVAPSDVVAATIEPLESDGERQRAELVLYGRTGQVHRLPIGDLMRAARSDVSRALERGGVQVVDMR